VTRSSPPQVAFSAGEIDPLLHRRFDYQKFQSGLAKCHGFLPLPQGGFTRAPGSTWLGEARNTVGGILVPFEFAADDAVVLEFTAGYMRVWRYGALVMNVAGTAPYELATPFDLNNLNALRWVQSADVIYLADGVHPVQKLSRFALNNWTIGAQAFDTGPFRVQNLDEALTVQASATSGTITLTASSALFQAGHVGGLMQISPSDNTTIPLWTSNEDLRIVRNHLTGALGTAGTWGPEDVPPVDVIRRYGKNVYKLTQGTDAGTNPPIHESGEALVDNKPTKWLHLNDDVGIVRITSITSATVAQAVVVRPLSLAVVASPTYRWSEGAWSDLYGYPSSLEIFDQRLVAAATPSEPRTVWFSTVGDYADFLPGVEADSAFAYTIAGDGSQNRITGLRRGRAGLHIFALSEEYSTRSESRAQVIGPTTAVFSLDGSTGARPGRPIAPYGDPIFISRDGRKVVQITYSFQEDSNREAILSRASQHLAEEGLTKLVWQSLPEPRAWILRTTGDLLAMTFDPAEEVLGFSTHSLGFARKVLDLCVSPSADGSTDDVYMLVRSTRSGLPTKVYVEKLDYRHHLFSAKNIGTPVLPPPPTQSVPWLANQSVTFWTSNNPDGFGTRQETIVVPADGVISSDVVGGGFFGWVGLTDPSHVVETLDIQAAAPDGNSMGRLKRLHAGWGLALHKTAGGSLKMIERHLPGRSSGERAAQAILPRDIGDYLPPQFTGILSVDAPTGMAAEVALQFLPDGNAALTVTGITPTIQEAGR
jgi:hypothetical protein